MSSSLRHILIAIAIVLLAVLAHGRLLEAGWLGDDLHLIRMSFGEAAYPSWNYWMYGGEVRPLPTLILCSTTDALAGSAGNAHAVATRVIAFVILLLGALTAGLALRRALAPWVGGDTARAAGFASALLIAVHPLAGAALARPRALGDLLAWLLGALAAFLFLRGRQMREKRWIVAAGAAAVLTGFASWTACLLPFVLAALEFGSARRPRPLGERVRTACTTLVIFAACVFVETLLARSLDLRRGEWSVAFGQPDPEVWAAPLTAIASCVEKLGLLFFPITGGSLSRNWPNFIVCIAIMLIALWPALRSARAAPKSWGFLAAAWIGAMWIALVPLAAVKVTPEDGSRADALVIAAAFAAAGVGVAATSLLGTRRIVLPALIAIGFSWLSARNAGTFVHATDTVRLLTASITEAQQAVGEKGQVLVVDPPRRQGGLDLGTEPLRGIFLEHGSARPLALPAEAIPALTRTPRFAEWRAHKIAILQKDGLTSVPTERRVIEPTAGTGPPAPWREQSRSELFDLDPASVRFARVRPLAETSTAEAPRIAWRASQPAGEGTAIGVWVEDDSGPFAVFDLWRHDAWWTASTIRRVSAEDPLVKVALFELLDELPLAIEGGMPKWDDDDWVFEIRDESLARPLRGTATFVLEMVARPADRALRYARIECEESLVNGVRQLRARGAGYFQWSTRDHHGRSIFEWSLERRLGDVVIARTSGNTPP